MDIFDDPVEEAEEEVPVYETEFENIPEPEQSYEELEPVESVESEGTDYTILRKSSTASNPGTSLRISYDFSASFGSAPYNCC